MKKLNLIVALCAILLSAALLSKNVKAGSKFFFGEWFRYYGTDRTLISSYSSEPGAMGCSGSEELCDIYVASWGNHNIDPSAFSQLRSESSNFTVAGSYPHGIVELRND